LDKFIDEAEMLGKSLLDLAEKEAVPPKGARTPITSLRYPTFFLPSFSPSSAFFFLYSPFFLLFFCLFLPLFSLLPPFFLPFFCLFLPLFSLLSLSILPSFSLYSPFFLPLFSLLSSSILLCSLSWTWPRRRPYLQKAEAPSSLLSLYFHLSPSLSYLQKAQEPFSLRFSSPFTSSFLLLSLTYLSLLSLFLLPQHSLGLFSVLPTSNLPSQVG
jgi:hypothetical protein